VRRMDAAFSKIAMPCSPRRLRVTAWSATLAVLAIAALVALRRAAGAFDEPLGVGPLAMTLLVAMATLAAGRVAAETFTALRGSEHVVFAWCGTIALWLLCLGCAPPSVRHFAWLVWLPIVAIEHVSRRRFLDGAATAPHVVREPPAVPLVIPPSVSSEPEDELVVQEIVRVRGVSGAEAIRGTLVADFAAGQRHAMLHVGFCPPLDGAPTIEVELVDGPDAAVKVTQAFAHGAAFELRLAEPAEEACAATVEFHAAPSAPLPHRG
jgi:hypothetical protein